MWNLAELGALAHQVQESAQRLQKPWGMRVRITRRCRAAVDGFSVAPLEVGRVYDLKPSVATFLIATDVHSLTKRVNDRKLAQIGAPRRKGSWQNCAMIAKCPRRCGCCASRNR